MNGVSLVKGGNVNLSKAAPGTTKFGFGLSWDVKAPHTFDVDAFAICRNAAGKFMGADHLLYFNSNGGKDNWTDKANPFPYILNKALCHSGDERTGAAAGDDETITFDTSLIPADVETIVIAVNIYQDPSTQPNPINIFGNVANAKIRAFDTANPTKDLMTFDLSEDHGAYNCIIFGELYRRDGEWKFRALGEDMNGTIIDACNKYA